MSDDWEQCRLSEVLSIKHGYAFPGDRFTDDPRLPTLVTPANVRIGGGFQPTKPKTFRGEYPGQFLLVPGDVIVTMTDLSRNADTLGYSAIVPNDGRQYLHNQRIGKLVVTTPERVDSIFVAYLLRTRPYRDFVVGAASGSTVKHTSPSRIESYVAGLPPLPEQRRIASVLGAIDDLIESNRLLVDRLLATAKVAFGAFPSASAPEVAYADVVDISGGGTPSTKSPDFWNGDIHWATPSDMTALPSPFLFDTSRKISTEGLEACSSELYPAGSILMTSRATIGAFAIAEVPTAVNQGFIVVRPRCDVDRPYLLLEMMSRVPDYLAHANGSTFLEISRGKFKALTLPWPPEEDRRRLHDSLAPLLATAALLETEISHLTRTREELLPLLMSGSVRVAETEAA